MRNKRNRRIGSALTAEFGPALIIFFLVILFPMINLIGLAMGAGTLYIMAVECATKAGNATNFQDALASAQTSANSYAASGFGQFAKLTPVGGYNGSGMDLYVTDTNINTNVSTTNGPNTPFVSSAIDPSTYLYSYDAKVNYNVGPFMNMGAVPWIGGVPGIGVPAQLSFTVSRNVEHPETLIAGGGGGGGGAGGGPMTGGTGGGAGGGTGGGSSGDGSQTGGGAGGGGGQEFGGDGGGLGGPSSGKGGGAGGGDGPTAQQ